MMQKPRATLFDLDDTLAESFQPPHPSMVVKLARLLERMPLALITAAGFPRIERDFLPELEKSSHVSQFYIFPNSSAECFVHSGNTWKLEYDFKLTDGDRARIYAALAESVTETGLQLNPKYEPLIIDRDVQIAYAALGLKASEEDKLSWDPDQAKRKLLKTSLEGRLPDFEVLIGGKTTIDITHKGINKAYGVQWLSKRLGIPEREMLYVGDALYPGGNDAVVIKTGIRTISVSGPRETEAIIDELCAPQAGNLSSPARDQ